MSFAFKIDKALKANLYKICRLCGIDREEKVSILDGVNINDNQPVDCDGELKLHEKIIQCIGITVGKDDKMPQSACSLCVDKINDIYEFREMCYATDVQTRNLLGLKRETLKKNTTNVKPLVDVKPVIDIKEETAPKRGRKRKADDTVPKVIGPKVGMPRVVLPKVVIPKEDLGTEVKSEIVSHFNSNKKQRLMETFPVETKKKGKLGKQLDKAIKPKEEIKEEPAEIEKPSSAPNEKINAMKFKQVCSICTQRFVSKLKLDQHVAATHLPHIPRYVCTACNESIKKTNDIKSHQLWHKLTKTPYMCGHCGQSLISSYAYSRHLRDHTVDVPPNLWVLDRECPQCHHTFLTNFLYNTHVCAVKTKKCAGCNRQLRNEVEYQRHAAHCNKVYLNYSKHISAAAASSESSIRIKNENDVEAAAAEALARNSGISLNMAPVVSLTRISTPEIMAARQGILDFSTESAAVKADEAKTPGKKGSKKGVSRKDLKRVDNLLKSTLDALVSIKHEPEVHVETDAETAPVPAPAMSTETTVPAVQMEPFTDENANKEKGDCAASDDDNFTHPTDYHHGDDDDSIDDNLDVNSVLEATLSIPPNNKAIKQEPMEETGAQGAINIKQEVIDLDNDNYLPAAKMPVLKLKIKKEHGMLNSSIVDEQSDRAEKKKKKKKRKDAARNKDKASDGEGHLRESNAMQDEELEAADEAVPNTNIVVAIKQEKIYENDDVAESHRAGSSEPLQVEPTVMTTIPIPQFQISAVSSGVSFDDNIAASADVAEQSDIDTADADATTEMTRAELDLEDIKPNKAELDRLFKITSISSGVQMDNEVEAENDIHSKMKETALRSSLDSEEAVANVTEAAHKRISKNTPKVVKHKQVEQKTRPATQVRAAKAFKSTAGVSKSNTNTNYANLGQIQIKPEPVDRGYEDVFNAYEAAANPSPSQPLDTRAELSIRDIGEHEYLKNIDFANIQIKQEKDLDVSDVEITNTHIVANAIPNGMNFSNGEESQYSENEEDVNSMGNEETEDDEDDDDDNDWDGVKVGEDEKREYRELEMPPLLSTEESGATENQKADEVIQEEVIDKKLACQLNNANLVNPSTSNAVEPSPAKDLLPFVNNVNMTSLTEEINAIPLVNEPTTSIDSTVDSVKSNKSQTATQPPFIISGIYSQAENVMTHHVPEVMGTDVNMPEMQYSDTVTNPPDRPMELQTLKISSVFASCSASFGGLQSQQEPQQLNTIISPEHLSTTLLADNAMEIGGNALNIAMTMNEPTGLLQSAVETLKIDMSMDTTPATQTMCMEMNVDKDVLLEAQPFADHDSGVSQMTAATATTITTYSNENVGLGLSIQNVVGGAIGVMSADIAEETQNLLNHEVVEAQASHQQQLTFDNTTSHTQQLTQNVEETENRMNEGVAEALLLQQLVQQQYRTDIQISSMGSAGAAVVSMLMLNDVDADKTRSTRSNCSSETASCSSVGRTSQSTIINNAFLIDDSNINEIAENNNNANIERELQDDFVAAVAHTTPSATMTVESNNENAPEEHTNAELTNTQMNDIT